MQVAIKPRGPLRRASVRKPAQTLAERPHRNMWAAGTGRFGVPCRQNGLPERLVSGAACHPDTGRVRKRREAAGSSGREGLPQSGIRKPASFFLPSSNLPLGSGNEACPEKFPRRLMVNASAPVFFVVDGQPIHRARSVKGFVEAQNGRLELHDLPSSAVVRAWTQP